MNMKKTVAGIAAGAIAVSAMAMNVSALNKITYTGDQAAFTKTWDFTATKFPVTWEGKTSIALSTATTGTPAAPQVNTTGAITFGAAPDTVALNVTYQTYLPVSVVFDVSAVAAATTAALTTAPAPASGLTPATPGVITVTPAATAAGWANVTATAADIQTAISSAINATVTVATTGTGSATAALTAAPTTNTSVTGSPATTGTGSGYTPLIDTTLPASTLYVAFRTDDNDMKYKNVESVTLKVTGYVNSYSSVYVNAAQTISIPLVKVSDDKTANDTTRFPTTADNYWKVDQVAMSTAQSNGKVDLSHFTGGIISSELVYKLKDDSKTKSADATDMANKTVYKLRGDVQYFKNVVVADENDYFARFANGFTHTALPGGQATTIDTGVGSVASSDVVHGVVFNGLGAGTVKTSAGKYIPTVTKEDAVYYFSNPYYGATASSALVNGDGNVTSFKEEKVYDNATGAPFNGESDAKNWITTAGNVDRNAIVDVKWKNMLKEIQSTIGDAKGATLTFGVYSASSTDSGKGADSFNNTTDAKIASSVSAEDFSFAVNVNSSSKFYSAANLKDGKITLNWDDIVQGLPAGTLLDAAIRVKAGSSFTIDSVTIDVPAKTLADLSAGESTSDSASDITEPAAPAETEATTTAAATNPTTGNAPIALAVIPVAVIAAAVIAKKRG